MVNVIVPSAPAAFTVTVAGTGCPTQLYGVTFAIPAGVWTSGIWTYSHSLNVLPGCTPTQFAYTGGHSANLGVSQAGTFSAPCTGLQMADINAAAGKTLSGSYGSYAAPATVDVVTSFTLTLTGIPGSSGNPGICPT